MVNFISYYNDFYKQGIFKGEMIIATPDTSHLSNIEFQDVYEPAEDSYLLLDALEQDLDNLKSKPNIVIEIGSGSGIISSALSTCFPDALVIATDINPAACQATKITSSRNNNKKLQVIQTDFVTCLSSRLNENTDLLVCNPPYVATDEGELGTRDIAASWAGGHLGLNLTRRVVKNLTNLLSPDGVAYLVLEQEIDSLI